MSNTIQVTVNSAGIQGPRGSSHNATQRQTQSAMQGTKLMGQTLKASTSSSMIGMGNNQRKTLINAGGTSRQNSQGPTGSQGFTPTNQFHMKQTSRDFGNNEMSGVHAAKTQIASRKASNNGIHHLNNGLSASKIASGGYLGVNVSSNNNRSNSRTSGNSAISNVSNSGAGQMSSTGTGGSIINSRISEQNSII